MGSVRLCPVCGSGKVLVARDIKSRLATTPNGHCSSCKWVGPEKDLVVRELELGQADEIAKSVAEDLVMQLAIKAGVGIGDAIITAGLIGKDESKVLARLIRTAVFAAYKAVLEEVDMMQQEIKHDSQ